MKLKEVIANLKEHNAWRRGKNIAMMNPKVLGKTIDTAIELLKETREKRYTIYREYTFEEAKKIIGKIIVMNSKKYTITNILKNYEKKNSFLLYYLVEEETKKEFYSYYRHLCKSKIDNNPFGIKC